MIKEYVPVRKTVWRDLILGRKPLTLKGAHKLYLSHEQEAKQNKQISNKLYAIAEVVKNTENAQLTAKETLERRKANPKAIEIENPYAMMEKYVEKLRENPSEQPADKLLKTYLNRLVLKHLRPRQKSLLEYFAGNLTRLHKFRTDLERLAENHKAESEEHASIVAELENNIIKKTLKKIKPNRKKIYGPFSGMDFK